ncbi:hypothetical protein L6164_025718 [Bauhinia variegata]|uniref:Uncharacterized protein n=1 Tax=Bauhinia variegata TaxID=167791 RepID=A0ACB9M1N2_BAUVA|nr:hypothetical protein L6164_025718 [Bauhinia variegata]
MVAFPNRVIALSAFLLLQSLSASSDFLSPLSPLLSPVFGDLCKDVACGKGTCKRSNNGTFPAYVCECEDGWKQTRSDDDNDFKFLPCIVPNCSVDYSCSKAPSPVQEKAGKTNASIFDVCHWVDCGGGSCNKTSMFTYSCECNTGYYNLFNATAFPCYKECALGMDCSNLGIPMTNSSSSSAPPALDDSAGSIVRGSSLWLVMLMVFMTKILLG